MNLFSKPVTTGIFYMLKQVLFSLTAYILVVTYLLAALYLHMATPVFLRRQRKLTAVVYILPFLGMAAYSFR